MKITVQERNRQALDADRIAEAAGELRARGYVALEGCMPEALVEDLRREYDAALQQKIERLGIRGAGPDERRMHASIGMAVAFQPIGGNHDFNRWNMHLPSRLPFLDELVVANPIVLSVVKAVVGDDVMLKRAASDTAFPDAGYQNPHRDLHRDVDGVQVVANVPLVETTESNGPLEIWPYTHLRNHDNPHEPFTQMPFPWTKEEMARYVEAHPPERQFVPAGTFIVRDLRILHRGSPNRGPRSRPMLSLAYRPPPARVPHPMIVDGLSRLARFAREQGRQGVERSDRLLNEANAWGRSVENDAGTDRDYRRPIPSALWERFSPLARSLFRFAEVEGHPASNWSARASAQLAAKAAIAVPLGLYLGAQHWRRTRAAP